MAIAERWEYNRISVTWSADDGNWVYRASGREDIWGFYQILDHFGQQGWELVAVEPYQWMTPRSSDDVRRGRGLREPERLFMGQPNPNEDLYMYRTWLWEVTMYYCFFKKRLA